MNTKTLLRQFMLLLLFSLSYTIALSQASVGLQWDKTFGGNHRDALFTLRRTTDGGYILGGESNSGINGNKTAAHKGAVDYWIVKIDASGNKQWDKTYGGSGYDGLRSILQTSDGGYILGGSSGSGISGDKTESSKGINDYWVVKIDANGNKQWDKTYGGSGYENFHSLCQATDGGYILGGSSQSGISGDKSTANLGVDDYWIVKIDANGNKQWDKTYGGSDEDYLASIKQTSDGGYILGGSSWSDIGGNKSVSNKGEGDFWIVKIDVNGNKRWDRTYGGSSSDYLHTLQQTSEGGYILGGSSYSGISGDKTEPCRGYEDYWIVKIDANGNKKWDRTYGGVNDDDVTSLEPTSDGGYILGGISYSSGISADKTEPGRGFYDYWIVKVKANGNKQWDRTFGGSDNDILTSIQQTSDGGYMLGGYSESGISGDKTAVNRGESDFWVVKLNTCTPKTYYLDNDGDGHGNLAFKVQACSAPLYYVADSTDCDDKDSTIYTGAPELCDGKDNNCDGNIDENCPIPTMHINDVSIAEGDGSQTWLKFKVSLSDTAYRLVSVDFTTLNGTAKAPDDYTTTKGALFFAPGTKTQFIYVQINGDKQCEGDEVFKVKLSNPANAILKDSIGRGTILNDDSNCIVSGSATTPNAFKVDSRAAVAVTPNPASGVVNIRLNSSSGSTTIQLISLQGKLLKTVKAKGSISEQLNVADIASGTYFLVLTDEKGNKQTAKLVVVH